MYTVPVSFPPIDIKIMAVNDDDDCNVLLECFIHRQRNALCKQDTHTGIKIKQYSSAGLKYERDQAGLSHKLL